MVRYFSLLIALASVGLGLAPAAARGGEALEPLKYNHPGLVVDLGVGLWAWPLPMDYDGDGDLDLIVSCPDVPFKGTYLFENPGGDSKQPVFKAPKRIGPGYTNIQPSYVGDDVRVLIPGKELVDFRDSGFSETKVIYPQTNILPPPGKIRANQWTYVDFDGDGDLDLIVGVGDWAEYGWDDAFDAQGNWTRGPLHGLVYLIENTGDAAEPKYAEPRTLQAGGKTIDVYGMPSPNFADFDGDGDLDLLCGEFLDGFTYFENVGSRNRPEYAAGRRLVDAQGQPIRMDLQMVVPVAIDWDGDGDMDIICGDEDGRVALIEHTGEVSDGQPRFLPPVYFRQEADDLKFGALVTPSAADWDGDGDEDLICGNSAGYLAFVENLGGNPPRWAAPVKLEAGGSVYRSQAGPNGSIQGPCEAKWGYTAPCVADWDGDGDLDILVNTIWGKVEWLENVGSKTEPRLEAARPVTVAWPGQPPKPEWNWWNPEPGHLVTQWRTTPAVADLTGDGLNDLAMLDHEGYLALFERVRRADGSLDLLPGRRVFRAEGPSVFASRHDVRSKESGLLRLNDGRAGASGRRKIEWVDWDGDGDLDLLVNSKSVHLLRNLGRADDGTITLRDEGPLSDRVLAGHTTCPTTVDWDRDGVPDLIVGAEDGRIYYAKHPEP